MRVVDRDGRVLRGGPAVIFVLSRLPVTAWFTLPLLVVLRAAATGEWTDDRAPHPGSRE